MDNEQFDKYIKSCLENGTEEVPPRIWERIQSQLPSEMPGASDSARWWKRALAGIALACVAAAAVMLFLPETTSTAPEIAVVTSTVESSETAAVVESTPGIAISELVTTAGAQTAGPAGSKAGNVRPDVDEIRTVEARTVETTDVGTATAETTMAEVAAIETATAETTAVEITEADAPGCQELSAPKSYAGVTPLFPEEEKSADNSHLELSFNANGAENIGGHSYGYGRLSASRMESGQGETLTETEATNYLIPISAGISVRYNFNERWALSIGINYTYLNRHFKGDYDYGGIEIFHCDNVNNDQHFFGIPVSAFYTIHSGNKVKFYASLGGAVEKCVCNKYSFNYASRNKTISQGVAGLQASVNAGIGIQVNVTKNLGIYLDPSFRYYFKNYLQPKSIRTVQPMQIGAELGLRWDL